MLDSDECGESGIPSSSSFTFILQSEVFSIDMSHTSEAAAAARRRRRVHSEDPDFHTLANSVTRKGKTGNLCAGDGGNSYLLAFLVTGESGEIF